MQFSRKFSTSALQKIQLFFSTFFYKRHNLFMIFQICFFFRISYSTACFIYVSWNSTKVRRWNLAISMQPKFSSNFFESRCFDETKNSASGTAGCFSKPSTEERLLLGDVPRGTIDSRGAYNYEHIFPCPQPRFSASRSLHIRVYYLIDIHIETRSTCAHTQRFRYFYRDVRI